MKKPTKSKQRDFDLTCRPLEDKDSLKEAIWSEGGGDPCPLSQLLLFCILDYRNTTLNGLRIFGCSMV